MHDGCLSPQRPTKTRPTAEQHERQDFSTGYVVRALTEDIRLNHDHVSGHQIIKTWDEVVLADQLAHLAYCPTMVGRRAARFRWHHRIHLIPDALLELVCTSHDRAAPNR